MNHVNRCRICAILQKNGFDAVGKRYRHGHYPDQDWASSSRGEAMYHFCLRTKLPEEKMLALRCEIVMPALVAAGVEDPRPALALEVGLQTAKKPLWDPEGGDIRYLAWRGCQDLAYECYRKGVFGDDMTDLPYLRMCSEYATMAGVACFPGLVDYPDSVQAVRDLVKDVTIAHATMGEPRAREDQQRRKEEYLQLVANKVREIFPWEALQQHLLPAPTGVEGRQNERVTMRKPAGEPS